MWTCYVTFCLERFKRKTNVQELKDKVTTVKCFVQIPLVCSMVLQAS